LSKKEARAERVEAPVAADVMLKEPVDEPLRVVTPSELEAMESVVVAEPVGASSSGATPEAPPDTARVREATPALVVCPVAVADRDRACVEDPCLDVVP
jgi:hypothetical protein